jgi:radical SAM superfamily enzyme YgiQ (UPF0313 family)
LTPSENGFYYPDTVSLFSLSLALGVLSGYLRNKGLDVDMYDLNTTLSGKFRAPEQKSRFEVLLNRELVLSYIQNGENEQLDNLLTDLLSDIDLDQYDSFGISMGADFSFIQIHSGFLIGHYLQKKYGKTVIIGGNNISYLYVFREVYDEIWKTVLNRFPYIIKGPGEQAIWDIVTALNSNNGITEMNNLNGLVRVVENKVVSNREYTPLIIRPDWDGLDLTYYYRYMRDDTGSGNDAVKAVKDNFVYFYKWPNSSPESPGQLVHKYNRMKGRNIVPRLIISYVFNYNCPFNCAFCTQSDSNRGEVVIGEVETIIEDIIALKNKYNSCYFYFFNNAFNYSGEFVDEFCQQIIDREIKIYWSDCGRFNNLTYERLKLMRDSGCVKLTFGFETGSEKILKLIDKKLDLAKAEQILKWCYDLGIWADMEVIVGLPQESNKDFNDTCDFIQRNSKYINHFLINEFFVLPDSLIGKFPERYGIELIDNLNYNVLVERNLKSFQKNELPSNKNAKIYGYNEITGRSYKDILIANRKNLSTISSL